MNRTHYHVGYNMPGYMPDTDPYVVSSKREAISAVADEARRLNDDPCDDMGNEHGRYAHGPYHKSGRAADGSIWLVRRACSSGGSDLHVWWNACTDTACEIEDDNS